MKKATKHKKKIWKQRILLGCILLIGAGVLLVGAVYLWPLRDAKLQKVEKEHLTYEESIQRVKLLNQTEASRGVTQNCQSRLLTHGAKTAKSVVMYHGVSGCSYQFSDLAQYFYERGYNVYVPTAPQHGTVDNKAYSAVTSEQLVDFANQSANITSGLGKNVGAIGLSGGGMLATWTTQYHTNMQHLVVLSPFFEPSRQQAAAYKIKPFLLLYGKHILPDSFSVNEDGGLGLSFYALTQFVTIGKNLPEPAARTDLKSVGLVMAEDDDQINQTLAHEIIGGIATSNNLALRSYDIPADWKIGHVIVGPENTDIEPYRKELYQRYFDMYNN